MADRPPSRSPQPAGSPSLRPAQVGARLAASRQLPPPATPPPPSAAATAVLQRRWASTKRPPCRGTREVLSALEGLADGLTDSRTGVATGRTTSPLRFLIARASKGAGRSSRARAAVGALSPPEGARERAAGPDRRDQGEDDDNNEAASGRVAQQVQDGAVRQGTAALCGRCRKQDRGRWTWGALECYPIWMKCDGTLWQSWWRQGTGGEVTARWRARASPSQP